MKKLLLILSVVPAITFAGVTSWENSPNNWENNPNNWDSDRIIRNNDGDATGYAVPNSNGVINIYDLDGNREGYVPK